MTRMGYTCWFLAGLAGGVAAWILAVVVLTIFGFSFAAVMYGPVLELAAWLAGAITLRRAHRRHSPSPAARRAVPLMAGILATTVCILAGELVEHPHWLSDSAPKASTESDRQCWQELAGDAL